MQHYAYPAITSPPATPHDNADVYILKVEVCAQMCAHTACVQFTHLQRNLKNIQILCDYWKSFKAQGSALRTDHVDAHANTRRQALLVLELLPELLLVEERHQIAGQSGGPPTHSGSDVPYSEGLDG